MDINSLFYTNRILRTAIHSLEGAGRFVIGLAADVKILEGDALRKYILDYQKSTSGSYDQ